MDIPKLEVTLDLPNFSAHAESKRVFIPTENKGKDDKPSIIPIRVRHILLTCKRSGTEIKFSAMTRDGKTTFGDSRETADRLKVRRGVREMRTELERMLGEDAADRLINVATF